MYQDIAVARGPTYDTLNARMDKCQQNIETMSDDIQRLQVTGLMGLESSAANDPSVWLDLTQNQEKALVGAFSVIVKTDGSFAALLMGLESPDLGVYNTC